MTIEDASEGIRKGIKRADARHPEWAPKRISIQQAKQRQEAAKARADVVFAREVRRAQGGGLSMKKIASELGISRQALYAFLRRAETCPMCGGERGHTTECPTILAGTSAER